jgi:hypothetical protein
MAIKMGWDFPSPTNASTRGYTRERGQGTKSPAVGRDETQKNRDYGHERHDPRAGRYARGLEFDPVPNDKSEVAEVHRTGRKATQSGPQKFAKGGAVCAEPAKKAVHKHERHDHKGAPLTKLKEGGPLTSKKRDALKSSTFALPGRRYPINDENHARNALARVSGNGSSEEKAKVRAAVHRKYPSIGKK